MNKILADSLYFGLIMSLFSYWLGIQIRKRWNYALFHPLLISIVIVIIVLMVFKIPYNSFNQGAKYLNYLLAPATVCLALPLYRQVQVLKEYWKPVLCGLLAGCLTTLGLVVGMGRILQLDEVLLRSLLPKSLTTAIAIGVSEEIGGLSPVTAAAVLVTGIIGAVVASAVFRIFKIQEPVAQGLACGASAHAVGTSKALEMGEVQGAMSSLAIVVTGIFTVLLIPVVIFFFS